MRKILCIVLALPAFIWTGRTADQNIPAAETKQQHDQRMGWFREARFGLFIHWGLYAVPAGEWQGKPVRGIGEWIMNSARIPVADYEKLAGQINPVKFNAREWVSIAKDAGMKYIVITSKHHDGFSMFDSKVSNYTIFKSTPFRRDPMKELAEACRDAGIKFCFYHSIMDWHHPDAQSIGYPNYNGAPPNPNFVRYVESYLKPQVRELLTNYGRLGIMWFDGEWIKDWTSEMGQDLHAFCRSLQPDVIVNNRVGKARAGMSGMNSGSGAVGDYGTPEQEIPATGFGPGVDWESCMTMNDTWGFKKDDNNWKPLATLIRMLIDSSSKGGNFLLNVGPTAEGLIPGPSVDRLAGIGAWMKVNSEAIYGTSASPFRKLSYGKCTQKPGRLYLHVFQWPADGRLVVPIRNQVARAYLLADRNRALVVTAADDGMRISVPAAAPDPVASVIVVEIKGEPQVIDTPLSQGADGSVYLPAEDAEIRGSRVRLEDKGGVPNIGYWSVAADFVQWSPQINRPGIFDVELTYACDPASAGNEYVVAAGDRKLTGKTTATRGWDDFSVLKAGQISIDTAGKAVVTLRPAGAKINGAGLMNLRSIILKPAKAGTSR
jgi:alpha-L-fucosidase